MGAEFFAVNLHFGGVVDWRLVLGAHGRAVEMSPSGSGVLVLADIDEWNLEHADQIVAAEDVVVPDFDHQVLGLVGHSSGYLEGLVPLRVQRGDHRGVDLVA